MNKVTTINLNGQAYQLEEKGYQALHAYLEDSAKALDDNPDKKEILADLEQAIADKCERLLQGKKDVVTSEQVDTILAEMGPVQTDDGGDETANGKARNPRRLYVVQKGAMIMGVCNGLAAFSGIDVTIVRIVFIILAFATGGFWILVYLLLGILLPVAKTDGQVAEAYGRRVTAQEIVDNAKDRARNLEPALSNVGTAIGKLVRIGFGIAAVVFAIWLGLATTAWLSVVGWLAVGNLHLTGQMATISSWSLAAAATAAYCLVAVPLFGLSRVSQRIARQQEPTPLGRNLGRFGFVLWFAALAVLIVVVGSTFGRVRDYVNSHRGYLDVNGNHICVDRPVCHPEPQYHGDPIYVVPDQPDVPDAPPKPQLVQ